ncbi:TolC family protein [Coxiella burnetii]|uniref:TolC family protein n=1 Tax=Coxiella burnetii TaxID=777 RepID=UPI000CCC9301|nr:TolC family protein [Coxiella burnetii]PNT89855.1 TolC family protein [Coxiella burnetii]
MKAAVYIGFFLLILFSEMGSYGNFALPAPCTTMVESHAYFHPHAPLTPLPFPRAFHQRAKHLSLSEAILLALRNNPDVISSELQRVVDKFALEVAHNEFEPQFTLGGTAGYAWRSKPTYSLNAGVSVKTPLGAVLETSYGTSFTGGPGSATITITQPLLKGAGWAYNIIDFANAVDDERVARLTFKNSIITAVDAVIKAYRTLVEDYNKLTIQRRTLLRIEQTVRQSELRVKAGKLAPSDLLQQQANLASTRLSMMQQQSSLDADYQAFLKTLGLTATAKVIIDQRIEEAIYPIPSVDAAIRLALLNNIDYQTSVIQLRAARRAVISAKNQARWQLDVVASTTIGNGNGNGGGSSISPISQGSAPITGGGGGPSLGFTLNIPINDVQAKAQIIDARIELEQAKLALEEKKEDLIRNVTNQINQLHNQYAQIKVAEHGVELQRRTLENAQLKLRFGKTTVFEVNQLQDQLLEQETDLVAQRIEFLNAITDLDNTLGITLDKWGITLRY